LHDTALGTVVDIEVREPGRFSMYVCGPTVYDVPHLGHGRNVLVYDILRRYLEWRGDDVHHVSNITDIDDNIIKRAARDGRSSEDVAVEFERAWKLAKAGEPSWPSPWGDGRPGWHTECVVMSLDLLGEGFDLHTGGLDLMFPHHENERAQAVALGRVFARHWVHHAFVEVAGEKMSKSLNNFTSLTDLLASTDPRAYRLLVLQSHYRKPLDVTRAATTDAEGALATLDAFGRRANELPEVAPDETALARFRERMEDDLDTPSVVADLADLRRRANTLIDAGDAAAAAPLAAAFREIVAALGLRVATEPSGTRVHR
jgi:cysteinyl-tRNA synthetase